MLWLHIGLPKTGSSAIQAYLRQNRQALSDMGVFYAPAPKEDEDDWRISSGNGVRLARHLSPFSASELARDDDPIKGFARRFVSDTHPLSLVSSEGFAGAERAPLARFQAEGVGDRPVRVLALVRDVYGHAQSAWRQTIKRGGYDGAFATFCRDRYQVGQGAALSIWAHQFGAEAMQVIHYDSIADDLIPAFFRALDAGAPPSAAAAPVVNRSLTVNESAVLAECNRIHGGSPQLARRLSDHLIYRHPHRIGARVVDPEAAAIIAGRFTAEVADLNARYFDGRQVLRVEPTERDLTDDEEPSLAEVWRDVAEALLQAYGQEEAEANELEVQNLVMRARKRLRKGEAEAAADLLQRALALEPENRQALALGEKMRAAAARRSERERERQEDQA